MTFHIFIKIRENTSILCKKLFVIYLLILFYLWWWSYFCCHLFLVLFLLSTPVCGEIELNSIINTLGSKSCGSLTRDTTDENQDVKIKRNIRRSKDFTVTFETPLDFTEEDSHKVYKLSLVVSETFSVELKDDYIVSVRRHLYYFLFFLLTWHFYESWLFLPSSTV